MENIDVFMRRFLIYSIFFTNIIFININIIFASDDDEL